MSDSSSSLGPAGEPRHSGSKVSSSTGSAFDSADCVHIADSSAADERLREERMTVVKALFVWVMLTASGWIYISPEWIPLFSHAIGFGFYLALTTRKTRWLGAVGVGGVLFFISLYFTMPEQWIVTVSHSVGYMTLILFVALAFVYKVTVVQEPVRDAGAVPPANGYFNQGMAFLNQMKSIVGVMEANGGSGKSGNSAKLEPDSERRLLLKIIRNLEEKLIAADRVTLEHRQATQDEITRLRALLDREVESRLRTERDSNSDSAALRAECENLQARVNEQRAQIDALALAASSSASLSSPSSSSAFSFMASSPSAMASSSLSPSFSDHSSPAPTTASASSASSGKASVLSSKDAAKEAAKETKERDAREKDLKDRLAKEKESRLKESKDREQREKDLREKEREKDAAILRFEQERDARAKISAEKGKVNQELEIERSARRAVERELATLQADKKRLEKLIKERPAPSPNATTAAAIVAASAAASAAKQKEKAPPSQAPAASSTSVPVSITSSASTSIASSPSSSPKLGASAASSQPAPISSVSADASTSRNGSRKSSNADSGSGADSSESKASASASRLRESAPAFTPSSAFLAASAATDAGHGDPGQYAAPSDRRGHSSSADEFGAESTSYKLFGGASGAGAHGYADGLPPNSGLPSVPPHARIPSSSYASASANQYGSSGAEPYQGSGSGAPATSAQATSVASAWAKLLEQARHDPNVSANIHRAILQLQSTGSLPASNFSHQVSLLQQLQQQHQSQHSSNQPHHHQASTLPPASSKYASMGNQPVISMSANPALGAAVPLPRLSSAPPSAGPIIHNALVDVMNNGVSGGGAEIAREEIVARNQALIQQFLLRQQQQLQLAQLQQQQQIEQQQLRQYLGAASLVVPLPQDMDNSGAAGADGASADADQFCSACAERNPAVTMLPCGHTKVCVACAAMDKSCPICWFD